MFLTYSCGYHLRMYSYITYLDLDRKFVKMHGNSAIPAGPANFSTKVIFLADNALGIADDKTTVPLALPA